MRRSLRTPLATALVLALWTARVGAVDAVDPRGLAPLTDNIDQVHADVVKKVGAAKVWLITQSPSELLPPMGVGRVKTPSPINYLGHSAVAYELPNGKVRVVDIVLKLKGRETYVNVYDGDSLEDVLMRKGGPTPIGVDRRAALVTAFAEGVGDPLKMDAEVEKLSSQLEAKQKRFFVLYPKQLSKIYGALHPGTSKLADEEDKIGNCAVFSRLILEAGGIRLSEGEEPQFPVDTALRYYEHVDRTHPGKVSIVHYAQRQGTRWAQLITPVRWLGSPQGRKAGAKYVDLGRPGFAHAHVTWVRGKDGAPQAVVRSPEEMPRDTPLPRVGRSPQGFLIGKGMGGATERVTGVPVNLRGRGP